MKKSTFLCLSALLLLMSSCGRHNSAVLFDGTHAGNWRTTGDVCVQDSLLVLSGPGAKAVLKQGDYSCFELRMQLRTTPGAEGAVWFHTDAGLHKGYSMAIDNDLQDSVWWRMTGSLLSVRNLVKNFVRDGEWFALNIKVEGQAISVSLDGQPVVEYIEPAQPYRIAPHAKALLCSGTFALVSEGEGKIEFRQIEVIVPEQPAWDREAQLAGAVDETTDEIIRLHQADFPVLDYHVHLKGGLTREAAASQSRRLGINYAIAPNCGFRFPISSDKQVNEYMDTMQNQPFIFAMQLEGREWQELFSPATCERFNYKFTDALTFFDDKGRRTRIWIPEETWIGQDEQAYMEMLLDRICNQILQEPVDVYVNPCFLPEPLSQRFDELWTEERMDRFVDALKKSGKALEINELYDIPSLAILQRAKAAGVKFTFGSNNVTPEVSDLSYSLRMMKECGLTPSDMYKPPRR